MGESRKSRELNLTSEQREKIKALRQQARSPEARSRQAAIRAHYADKPDLAELIRRGDVNPDRMTTMGALAALHRALAAVRRARIAKGLSLSDVARRAGMPLPSLSRLENGKNPNFTFETLARYTAAVGLDLDIVIRDRVASLGKVSEPRVDSAPAEELAEVVDALSIDVQRLSAIVKRGVIPTGPPESVVEAESEESQSSGRG
jgi:transcriptional regulator with XRE-family HTH domain